MVVRHFKDELIVAQLRFAINIVSFSNIFITLNWIDLALYTNLTLTTTTTTSHGFQQRKNIVFILVVCLGIIFVLIGMSLSIYRYYSKKNSTKHYMPCVSTDGTTVLIQL